jgi:hypothetical protein
MFSRGFAGSTVQQDYAATQLSPRKKRLAIRYLVFRLHLLFSSLFSTKKWEVSHAQPPF